MASRAFIAAFLRGKSRGNRYIASKFVACDMPHADKPMLQIMGVFAEFERQRIFMRTKEALATLKARGVQLGGTNLEGARAASVAKRQALAQDGKARVMLSINDIRATGITTLQGIAQALNHPGSPRRAAAHGPPPRFRAFLVNRTR